jgi:hypothetical protein
MIEDAQFAFAASWGASVLRPTGLIDAMDAEAYQLLDGEIFHSTGF